MADKTVVIPQHSLKPLKIVKWKVNEGNSISIGCVMLLYKVDGDDNKETLKLKSTKAGTVHRIVAQEGDVVKFGYVRLSFKFYRESNINILAILKIFNENIAL